MTSCDWVIKRYAGSMIAECQNVGGHDILYGFDLLRAPNKFYQNV